MKYEFVLKLTFANDADEKEAQDHLTNWLAVMNDGMAVGLESGDSIEQDGPPMVVEED